jgi:DNA processing protein
MGEWELICQAIDLLSFLKGKEKIRTARTIESIGDFMNLDSNRLSRINNRILKQRFSPEDILSRAKEVLVMCEQSGIGMVTWGEDDYPQTLSHTSDPPFRLYYRGQPLLKDFEGTAIVGTRIPSWEGEKEAFRLGLELAGAECPVVSGLALGIDIEAHRGALAISGRT